MTPEALAAQRALERLLREVDTVCAIWEGGSAADLGTAMQRLRTADLVHAVAATRAHFAGLAALTNGRTPSHVA